MKNILRRGKQVLFVGGTGLYATILIDGIFEIAAGDDEFRAGLYKQAKVQGSSFLHNKLKKIDPQAASKIHPNDTKRIIRALEVFKITGKPISELQKLRKGLSSDYEIKVYGLNMNRANLYKRIDERVDKMFAKGLIDEIKQLLKKKLSKTACFAIGIKELKGYFAGNYDLEEAKRLMKKNTRNFAKRQLTWFRKDKRIKWVNINKNHKPSLAANKILTGFLNG